MTDEKPVDSLKDILNNLFEGVYIVNREREITFWNRGAENISGYSASEVLGKKCADNILRHVDDLGRDICTAGCPLAVCLSGSSQPEFSVYLHHRDGQRIPVKVRVQPLHDRSGEITGAIEFFTDISRDRGIITELEKLKKEVYRDHLTGVGNRKYQEFYFERLYEHFRLYGSRFGVLYIDIDNFKEINDTYGHETGDRVLKMTASTMQNSLRPFDILSRNGGDEFIVLLPLCSPETLASIAERLRKLVESSFLDLGRGRIIRVTVSIGTALAHPGCTKESLLQIADQKMYASKRNGRNRINAPEISEN